MPSSRRVAIKLDLQWPHKRHAGIFAGTQKYAAEQGWESIIDEYAAEALPQRRTKSIPYDGVIGRVNEKLTERVQRLDVPAVNVWLSSPVWNRLPGVFPDYAASGRLRAEHLLARGLRRFAALVREDRGHKREVAAFRETVAAHGFDCATVKVPLNPTRTYPVWKKSEQRINAWIEQWQLPIGVFVCGDEVGRLVAQMCQRRSWRVPQDVAIITGWNEETICEHPRPSLTSVDLGFEQIGYQAARLLDELMDQRGNGSRGKASAAPKHLLVPPQGVVVRESTDFFAVDDELVAAALTFIADHSHQRIGQDDVAQAVSTETRTLQNRFRKVLDRPIVAMIRQVRMERAKRELVQGDRSMQEIARDCGFGNPARMNDAFGRELGVTPSQYRQQRTSS